MIDTSPSFSKFSILQPSDEENHKYMNKYVNTDSTCIVDSEERECFHVQGSLHSVLYY